MPNRTASSHAKSSNKQRLDLLLVERGLVESRERARRLIMAGEVLVGTERIEKAGHLTAIDAEILVRQQPQFVSRGGLKLQAALQRFQLDVSDWVAVDVGASTGGFSDCLLQQGVARVYAIDVGYGQLAWKIRTDARVVPIERTNIRYLEALPEGILADLGVIDASFISLKLVLPATLRLLKPTGQVIALIKPQFEAGKDAIGKGGVVRESKIHRAVLQEILAFAVAQGLQMAGLTVSPAPGPAGNIEFLLWLKRQESEIGQQEREELLIRFVDQALEEAFELQRKQ